MFIYLKKLFAQGTDIWFYIFVYILVRELEGYDKIHAYIIIDFKYIYNLLSCSNYTQKRPFILVEECVVFSQHV